MMIERNRSLLTRMPKRWDSSSRNSYEKETQGSDGHIAEKFSAVSLEDENSFLKKRIAQLEAENEKLKSSVFLLTERVNKKHDIRLSIDALMSAVPPPVTPSPNASGIPYMARRSSATDIPVLMRPSKDMNDEESEDGGSLEEAVTNLTGHTSAVYVCKFSADGSALASTSLDTTVRLWNVSNNAKAIIGNHSQSGTDLAWFGSAVASSSFDMTMRIWDTNKVNATSPIASFDTNGLAFSLSVLNESSIVVGTSNGYLQRFDVRTKAAVTSHKIDSGVNAVCVFDCNQVLSGDSRGVLRTWDTRFSRCEELYVVDNHRPISGISCSSPNYIVVNSYDNALRIFSRDPGGGTKLSYTLRGHRNKNWPIRSAFSQAKAGSPLLVATGSATNSCYVFGHLSNNGAGSEVTLLHQLEGHHGSVYSCDFSCDNQLATCSADGTLKIWWKRL